MRRAAILSAIALWAFCSGGMVRSAEPGGSIGADAWGVYKARFVEDSGRVIDDANGNISHSEGQGYGLLLAYLADQPADFDLIWSFTRTELLLRDDGLAVWKWDPNASPHVSDVNNASDGDILIAYALALAGAGWEKGDLTKAAAGLAHAIGTATIAQSQGRDLLLPGAQGFAADQRPDGPVVNLSYWIFEAFPVLASVAPDIDWAKISADGLELVSQTQFGPRKLPPDWLSLKTRPKPAQGFAPEFGYNALRIPLYLMRAGVSDRALLQRLATGMSAPGGSVAIVDVMTGDPVSVVSDPGYRIIPALVACVLDGQKLPADLGVFAPTAYYPSTLQLLGLSFASATHPECLS